MSYLQYWKLACAPFSSGVFFAGGSIEEAIARIGFLVNSRRSLGILIGPSSVGKTLLFRNLRPHILKSASAIRPRIVYRSLLGLSANELYTSLARTLGEGLLEIGPSAESGPRGIRSDAAWNRLEDALCAVTVAKTQAVILLDDVSSAEELTLDAIHRILEANGTVSCILSVCSESLEFLPGSLRERCQLRVDLPAWDLGQTADYFDFALAKAKGRPGLFEAQAITRIHELSDGLPRRINRLSDLALVAGASKRIPKINSELVDQVFEEFSHLQPNYLENIAP
jgi:hypothetical protein